MYAIFFPNLFELFLDSSFSQTNNFLIHILLTAILLLPATILMGATIPIMTTVLPENDGDIDLTHNRVYGVNTLGAFLGTILVGFWLLPEFGYQLCLFLLGATNALASLPYILNHLIGESYQKENFKYLENNYNQKTLYLLSFVAGLTSLSLEVLWFRVLGLTIGNSALVFPFVLSIFILMMSVGALTLRKMNLKRFHSTVALSLIFSLFSFLTIPYLPLFISNIRVIMINNPITFYVFHVTCYLFILGLLAPALFYLGRLLPFSYALLRKNRQDYGLKCGYLYFFNTLGTFIGAIFLGYLAFYLFDLKTVYLFALTGLFLLGTYFLRRNPGLLSTVVILAVAALVLPFSRKYHEEGLFRIRNPRADIHFKNIIDQTNAKDLSRKIIYFSDGPNATVSVMEIQGPNSQVNKAIYVNGKSDGNATEDYGTVSTLALIPYLGTDKRKMKTALIGIGTGVTAGLMTSFERVSHLDVIEISDAVINSVESMAPENLFFHQSPKANIQHNDAFHFFKTTKHHYDIIASEPPNPWVVGVEDLFTKYFYEIVKTRLQPQGLFTQWLHTYSMSRETMASILNNIKGSFKNVTAYLTQQGDVLFVASNRDEKFVIKEQKIETNVRPVLKKLGLDKVEDLNFFEIHNSRTIDTIIKTSPFFHHEIFYPQLSRKAYRDFFLFSQFKTTDWVNPILWRSQIDDRSSYLKGIKELIKKTKCNTMSKSLMICQILTPLYRQAIKNSSSNSLRKRLQAYSQLRNTGLIKKDIDFIKTAMTALPNRPRNTETIEVASLALYELLKEQEFTSAMSLLEKLTDLKIINSEQRKKLLTRIDHARSDYQKFTFSSE